MTDRILVTGASGFLGSSLADFLEYRGWLVRRCARNPPADGRDWHAHDLGWTTVPEEFLSGVRTLVHAAFVPSSAHADSFAINVAGTRALIDAARKASVKVIFISSLAAHATARSSYGRQKRTIESLLGEADLAIRPGLIIGHGGIFARLAAHVVAGKPVPLVNRGSQPLQTIALDDLLACLDELLCANATGTVVLAEETAVAYRTFFESLGVRLGRRARLIDIPAWLLLGVATWATRLRVPLPIERDNVLGLMEMRYMAPTVDARYSLPTIRPYTQSIEAFCRAHEP